MNEFDDRLSEALGSPTDGATDAGGPVRPSQAAFDALRERGLRRRRRKIAAISSVAVGAVFVVGAVAVTGGRDDAILTVHPAGSEPTTAPPASSTSTTSSVLPPTSTEGGPAESTMPATTTPTTPTSTAPTTTAPTSTSAVPTTVPVTSVPAQPVPSSTTPPPVTSTTTTSTTEPPQDVPAVPLTVVPSGTPVTAVDLGVVSLEVSGDWPDASADASMLVHDYAAGALAVLIEGEEVVRVTQHCPVGELVCPGEPWGWVVGTSLWLAVDDLDSQHVFEVDLTTGAMVERMRGGGHIYDMVGIDGGIRFHVEGWYGPEVTAVADYVAGEAGGEIVPRFVRSSAQDGFAVVELDRSGERLLRVMPPDEGSPITTTYEVIDVATGALERAGSLSVDLLYLETAEFAGNRVVLGDAFLGAGGLLDLDAGGVIYEADGPGCLFDDGTAVFETRLSGSGVDAGPLVVVGLDGEVRETPTMGTGHNEGSTSCAGDRAIVHAGDWSVTAMTADGTSADLGYSIVERTVLQVAGRSARN